MRERIKIVLCNTTHPGNIGATARAMKTMGLTELTLVAPKEFPSAEVTARAAGADDILANAQIHTTLEQAIAGCSLVVATTARRRNIRWPEQSADLAAELLLEKVLAGQSIAIVFGQERSGLSNEQLDLCNFMIRIPTNPDFSSLNVASAVQIICYELNRQITSLEGQPQQEQLATEFVSAEQMDRFYQQLEQTLILLEYLDVNNSGKLMRRLRRLYNRTELDNDEYNILMGVLSSIQKKLNNQ